MDTKNKYDLVLKHYEDKDAFIAEMKSKIKLQNSVIPQRSCNSVFPDPKSRVLTYELSVSEAESIKEDNRIQNIEKINSDVEITLFNIEDYPLDDSEPSFSMLSNDSLYYGNQYANITIPPTPDVDIVIIDTVVAPNHTEFIADSDPNFPEDNFLEIFPNTNDNSRVFRFKNLDNTNDSYLRSNHGTAVASIAAGKTQGWARDARIITTNLYDFVINAQEIIDWHVSKSGERPTIVNCSFGYLVPGKNSSNVSEIVHQGTTHTKPNFFTSVGVADQAAWEALSTTQKVSGLADYCEFYTSKGIPIRELYTEGNDPNYGEGAIELPYLPYVYGSVNTIIDEFIESGIIVVAAGGNSGFEIDLPGGANYDNEIKLSAGSPSDFYYNRGATPASIRNGTATTNNNETICVGSISNHNYKSKWSVAGSGVDIFAPGAGVMAAVFDTSQADAFINNTSGMSVAFGTSFSSPQVCGVLGQVAQQKKNSGVNATNSTIDYTVTYANTTFGTRYFIDGSYSQDITLYEGNTYKFALPEDDMIEHPFRLSSTPLGTHTAGGSEYTTGVTISDTGVVIVVPAGAPDLHYFCTRHANMGKVNNDDSNLMRVMPHPTAGWPSNSDQAQASGLAYVTGTAVDNLYDTGIVGSGMIVYDDDFYDKYGIPGGLDNDLCKFSLKGAAAHCLYFDAAYDTCGNVLQKPPAEIGDVGSGSGDGTGLDETGSAEDLPDDISGNDPGEYSPSSHKQTEIEIEIEKVQEEINQKTIESKKQPKDNINTKWWWLK